MISNLSSIQRYAARISYFGPGFALGWQRGHAHDITSSSSSSSSNLNSISRSVQGSLETTLSNFVKHPVRVFGAGRTDAGVHSASGQVIHFDLERRSRVEQEPFEPMTVFKALNSELARTNIPITLDSVWKVPDSFHARYSAKWREYTYRIISPKTVPHLFERDRAWLVSGPIDVHAMQTAASMLIGQHDFSSFRNSGCEAKTAVRRLFSFTVEENPGYQLHDTLFSTPFTKSQSSTPLSLPQQNQQNFQFISIKVRGDAFLYRMVRNMVGMLIRVGQGRLSLEQVAEIVLARDRSAAPPLAPSFGLYLTHVEYNQSLPKIRGPGFRKYLK